MATTTTTGTTVQDWIDADATLAAPPMPGARITLAELASSFYLWLLLWLAVWAVVPTVLFGWQPVLITSGSMGPVITAGDLVLLDEPPADRILEPGTVITFRSASDPDQLVTHRIDGLREDGLYRTRGDANGQPDSTPVAREDIVGVGRMMVPLIGLPLLWARTDVLLLVGFVLASLAAVAVMNISRATALAMVDEHERFLTDGVAATPTPTTEDATDADRQHAGAQL